MGPSNWVPGVGLWVFVVSRKALCLDGATLGASMALIPRSTLVVAHRRRMVASTMVGFCR